MFMRIIYILGYHYYHNTITYKLYRTTHNS